MQRRTPAARRTLPFWQHLVRFSSLIVVAGILCQPQLLLAGPLPTTTPSSPFATLDQTYLKIELSRRRLTFYFEGMQVKSYPVAVGRSGWQTPVGMFQVMQMIQDPAWQNPLTGDVIRGGAPNNPLGRYWVGFWTDGNNWVGLHGTPNPESVGQAASHGCVRLYNTDIQELFTLIQVGTPVIVVP